MSRSDKRLTAAAQQVAQARAAAQAAQASKQGAVVRVEEIDVLVTGDATPASAVAPVRERGVNVRLVAV